MRVSAILPVIAGYCGNSRVLDEALESGQKVCSDQTEEDHQNLVSTIRRGDVKRKSSRMMEAKGGRIGNSCW